jgi:hypothetical protein
MNTGKRASNVADADFSDMSSRRFPLFPFALKAQIPLQEERVSACATRAS